MKTKPDSITDEDIDRAIDELMSIHGFQTKNDIINNNCVIHYNKPNEEAAVCEECGTTLNEDGFCPICDNYLYDHEE